MKRIGFSGRLLASLLDGVFFLLLLGSAVAALALTGTVAFDSDVLVLTNFELITSDHPLYNFWLACQLGPALFCLVYYSTEIFYATTAGKYMLGYTIVSENGGKASSSDLVKRYVIKQSVSITPLIYLLTPSPFIAIIGAGMNLIVLLGCFLIFGRNKQTLYDKISSVVVVKDSRVRGSVRTKRDRGEVPWVPVAAVTVVLFVAGFFLSSPGMEERKSAKHGSSADSESPGMEKLEAILRELERY